MDGKQALRELVTRSEKSQRSISEEMGRNSRYIATTLSGGRSPGTDLMAEIAEVCGYRLALVPRRKALPQGSIEIGREDGARG